MFPILPGSNPSGYNLTRSLRLRASASAYLSRAPASASNQAKWTYSFWVKLGSLSLGTQQFFLNAGINDANRTQLTFDSDLKLGFVQVIGGSVTQNMKTAQVLRDPSAWYHIVFVCDTAQATASNRAKIYVNGTQVTSFDIASYLNQNDATYINSTYTHYTGKYLNGSSNPSDWYMAEVNFIDGQALTPSSFGSTNALTGVWQPARYTGTYGTNGFYLPFTDNSTAAALGTDFSGNSNTWTTNNISVTAGVTYDSMTDVPTLTNATTANYCVLNPISNPNGPIYTISSGNLNLQNIASVGNAPKMSVLGSFFIQSGKWYWEVKETSVNSMFGITGGLIAGGNAVGPNYANISNGSAFGTAATYSGTTPTFVSGDVMGFAFDKGALTLAIYKNGTLLGTFSGLESSVTGWLTLGGVNSSAASSSSEWNFGQRPFAYTPPTGFVALNTFNLANSTIVKGNTVMDANLWTGDGTAKTIVNAAPFKPDFVWIKQRSGTASHVLTDSVRGAGFTLQSNNTDAEIYFTTVLTSFNSNGFSVGASGNTGANGSTYVGWQWQAGQGTTSSNTAGSITSTVSVNASAGFSVVTYTGTGANATVGHGLGVAPKWVIVKNRSGGGDWKVYTETTGNTTQGFLNDTAAFQGSSPTLWNSTSPTSTVFSIGTNAGVNQSAATHVAYCWSEIDGFSKFGSYTGNGSADGPFVYTGFRPKFVMFKRTDSSANWQILDSVRNAYNLTNLGLYPDLNFAEQVETNNVLDLLSNGFKVRGAGVASNVNGATYIYMAYAENPFKNSLAR
jgi:hypothetical protein